MSEVIRKSINLPMEEKYYNKKECVASARSILDSGQITGMTVRQLAAEIYTHAFIYYNFDRLPGFIRKTSLAQRIYTSAANGIDLEDNGDSQKRRICYAILWVIA